jgi:hypothetical protein
MYQHALDDEAEPRLQDLRPLVADPHEQPIVVAINDLAMDVMEMLGPMLWAALLVLFIYAELSYR